jgi:hypothetical protein
MTPGSSRRPHVTAAALLLTLTLSGCSTTPVRLNAEALSSHGVAEEPTEEEGNARALNRATQQVWIAPIEDSRTDTTLGSVAGRPFALGEVSEWLDRELASIASPMFVLTKVPESGATANLTVHPRLLKTYLNSAGTSKMAVVVMQVRFVSPAGVVHARVYRGQHASMNWASAEGEVMNALRDAAAVCRTQIRQDIETLLRSPP